MLFFKKSYTRADFARPPSHWIQARPIHNILAIRVMGWNTQAFNTCTTAVAQLQKSYTNFSLFQLMSANYTHGVRLHCCLSCTATEHWPFHQLQYSMERTFVSHSQWTITSMAHFICKNSTKKILETFTDYTAHFWIGCIFFSNQHCFFR